MTADFLTQKDFVEVDGYRVPPALPVRPLAALKAVFKLLADKEDTSQVYAVTNALSGRAHVNKFARFAATEYGRHVLENSLKIEQLLSDRERLASMPAGSVGRCYYEFMASESLSEDALLQATRDTGIDYTAPNEFKAFSRQVIHFKVTHDLWHVLTGYGRDGLGEICLLEFYQGQWRDRGIRLIITMGAASMKLQMPSLPVGRTLQEARRNSRAAKWIMGEDIEAYIETPLKEVRERLQINTPDVYLGISEEIKRGLLAPKNLADKSVTQPAE